MTLQDLFNDKPAQLWNKRMVEYGDDLFTEERLLMSDKVLNNYLNQLILLQETKHPGHRLRYSVLRLDRDQREAAVE